MPVSMKELKIEIQKLREARLFVATPMYGGSCSGMYMKSCLDLQNLCIKYGIDCRFSFIFNESLITRARNYLTDEFLRSDCTHLLFLDADIMYDPNDVIALLALALTQDTVDIIGAPYPKKTVNWRNIVAAVKKNPEVDPGSLDGIVGDYVFNPVHGNSMTFSVHEPFEVMEIGTGYMLIKRKVFEDFAAAYPEKNYLPDHRGTTHFDGSREICAYFDCPIDPVSRRYLSEDYAFCQMSRAIGKRVWLCPWMKTAHIGMMVFRGDMPAIAAATGELHS